MKPEKKILLTLDEFKENNYVRRREANPLDTSQRATVNTNTQAQDKKSDKTKRQKELLPAVFCLPLILDNPRFIEPIFSLP